MRIAGLPEREITPLVRAVRSAVTHGRGSESRTVGAESVDPATDSDVRLAPLDAAGPGPEDLDSSDVTESFARAAWSHLTEPGDGVAGILVRELGALAALDRVVARAPASAISAELAERAGGSAARERELAAALDRWRPRISSQAVVLALRQAARFGVSLVLPSDPLWPRGLDDLEVHAPHALWVRGRPRELAAVERSIAIVGARAATGYGEHVAVELASGLVDRGYSIVSGAAYGIDGVAHRAALASDGSTIAVLAGGLDRFYPSGHDTLLARVVEHGAAIAEVPCGTAPTRWRFLQRNRLIAAMSRATVVVEAGWRSGSLNTAHHAMAIGRPIGVVPGPVTSSASAGCHRLLRESPAHCVTSAAEVAELAPLALLEGHDAMPDVRVPDGLAAPDPAAPDRGAGDRDPDGTRTRLLDALSTRRPREADRIAALSGLGVDRVRGELGLLAIEGLARRHDTGWTRHPAPSARRRRRERDGGAG